MDRLWTPWRYEYITRARKDIYPGVPEALSDWVRSGVNPTDCVFCNKIASADYAIAQGMPAEEAEKAALVVARSAHCYLCLNAFPYSTGHVMIVPYRHVDSLVALDRAEADEMMRFAQKVEIALRSVYHPGGMNFGLNLGEAGGAGIAAHLHMHALPRWIGDANFMTVTADTRVLPETLEITWGRLREAWGREDREQHTPAHQSH